MCCLRLLVVIAFVHTILGSNYSEQVQLEWEEKQRRALHRFTNAKMGFKDGISSQVCIKRTSTPIRILFYTRVHVFARLSKFCQYIKRNVGQGNTKRVDECLKTDRLQNSIAVGSKADDHIMVLLPEREEKIIKTMCAMNDADWFGAFCRYTELDLIDQPWDSGNKETNIVVVTKILPAVVTNIYNEK